MNKDKFVPKVGEPCIVLLNPGQAVITPKFVGDVYVIFDYHGECSKRIEHFRCFKSTAETEREKAVNELVKNINGGDGDSWTLDLASRLIDAGYHNQPKVKPLSCNRLNYLEWMLD